MSARKLKRTPPRLTFIFQRYHTPVFFVTFNTHQRRPLLACETVHAALIEFGTRGGAIGAAVGRYVLMPDHLHAFVAIGRDVTLGRWVKAAKQHLGKALRLAGQTPARISGQSLISFWQPGYFDRLLRHDKSYAAKWSYIRENPFRAGLVAHPEEWPYQGEIVAIDRV